MRPRKFRRYMPVTHREHVLVRMGQSVGKVARSYRRYLDSNLSTTQKRGKGRKTKDRK
jgi:hypothetical protein